MTQYDVTWQKSFVDGDKTGLQEATPDDTIKAQEEVKQVAEELKAENFPSSFTAKGELKNTQALVDYVNGLEGEHPLQPPVYYTVSCNPYTNPEKSC